MEPKLKVFLSSAQFQDEFVVERSVLQILFSKEPLRSAFVLWKIENYSSPEGVANHSIVHVKDSDLLLLLLGRTLRAAVQSEFEVAIRKNIPVFVFIKNDVQPQDESLKKFIKEKLHPTVTTANYYSSIDDLTTKIEDSLLQHYFRKQNETSQNLCTSGAYIAASDWGNEEEALRLLVGILDTAEAEATREKTIESLIIQAIFSKGKATSIQDISDHVNTLIRHKDQKLKIDVLKFLPNLLKRSVIIEVSKGKYQLSDQEKQLIKEKQSATDLLLEKVLAPLFASHKGVLPVSDLSTYTKIIEQAIVYIVYHSALSNAAAEFIGKDSTVPYDAQEINRMAIRAVSSLSGLPGTVTQWQQAVVDVLKSDIVGVARWINRLRKAYWLLASIGCDPRGVQFKNRHIANYSVYLDSYIVLRAMVGAGGDAQLCKDIIEIGRNLKSKMMLSASLYREVESSIESANRSYIASGRNELRTVEFYKRLGRKSDILDGYISAKSSKPSVTWETFLNTFYSPLQPAKLKNYIENELGVTIEESEFSMKQLERIEQLCSVLLEKRKIYKPKQDTIDEQWARQYTLRSNEAKQMATVYELRKTPQSQHMQYWFVTFNEFVYQVSAELAGSGEAFYSFPCYMKPARWPEILSDASPRPLDINVFRNILLSPEISLAADYVESQVIAQMLQARVDKSIKDINTLRYMFSDIVNRPAVQDAYAEVMKLKGVAAIGASEKVKDRVIEALNEKMQRLKLELEEKQRKLDKASIDGDKAKGKVRYLKSQLTSVIKGKSIGKKGTKKK